MNFTVSNINGFKDCLQRTFLTELKELDDHELIVGKVNKQAYLYPSIHLSKRNSEIPTVNSFNFPKERCYRCYQRLIMQLQLNQHFCIFSA